jgi:hypothetical protein
LTLQTNCSYIAVNPPDDAGNSAEPYYRGTCTVTAVAECCKQLCKKKPHHHHHPKHYYGDGHHDGHPSSTAGVLGADGDADLAAIDGADWAADYDDGTMGGPAAGGSGGFSTGGFWGPQQQQQQGGGVRGSRRQQQGSGGAAVGSGFGANVKQANKNSQQQMAATGRGGGVGGWQGGGPSGFGPPGGFGAPRGNTQQNAAFASKSGMLGTQVPIQNGGGAAAGFGSKNMRNRKAPGRAVAVGMQQQAAAATATADSSAASSSTAAAAGAADEYAGVHGSASIGKPPAAPAALPAKKKVPQRQAYMGPIAAAPPAE